MEDTDSSDPGHRPGQAGRWRSTIRKIAAAFCVYDMPRVENEMDARTWSASSKNHANCRRHRESRTNAARRVRQAWRFSAANAVAKGVCALMGVPTSLVSPAMWKAG